MTLKKLAELNGLKWKTFSFANPLLPMPGDDQILSAFAKCLRDGVLCTWRRLIEPKSNQSGNGQILISSYQLGFITSIDLLRFDNQYVSSF